MLLAYPRTGFAGELKDSHGTTARAIRHARSPQRVRRRAQGFARHHSESAPTRPIPAEGSPASDPTRPIPAEGSPASSRIRTAPQRERSDTPDPRRGFIGELKDSHGTTPIPAEGSPASDPTRPIPAEGSPASSRIRTAPQRERSDTPDPRRGFIGELKDSHGTTPIPAEGSPASDPTRPIPAEGSPASSRIRTAPQRERSDTPDPRRGFTWRLVRVIFLYAGTLIESRRPGGREHGPCTNFLYAGSWDWARGPGATWFRAGKQGPGVARSKFHWRSDKNHES